MSLNLSCYTIGHSNHNYQIFFDLLSSYAIEYLVDVRSAPYSRYAGQFNKQQLHQETLRRGLVYRYQGDGLGGRPADPAYLLPGGVVDYPKLAASSFFSRSLASLIELIRRPFKVALLCAEKDPLRCHRFFLIGRALEKRGIKVFHILSDGRATAHFLLEEKISPDYNKDYFQPTFF